MTAAQLKTLGLVMQTVLEAVKEGGELGVPGGHLYAALMTQGCTLHQFETLMSALIRTGKIEKRGECYHAIERKPSRQMFGRDGQPISVCIPEDYDDFDCRR
jgi:hypothetical protein